MQKDNFAALNTIASTMKDSTAMNHTQQYLFTEGDINFSIERQKWYDQLDDETNEWLERDADCFMHQAMSTPCMDVIESCEGIYFTDIHGKKYMDFHGNNVHQVGYRNPHVIEKVKQQLDQLPFSPRRYTNKKVIEFSEKLLSLMPAALNKVLYAPGGTSAIGMALKLARVVTGKQKVVSLSDSFHGASLDAIAAGGEDQFKKYMGDFYPAPIHLPQPNSYRYPKNAADADILEDILSSDDAIGAFIAETIRNTDVQIPTKAWWQRIRQICTERNIVLILDEIPIAFGRTGKMFAFEHFDIVPDIVCLGKGLGAGIIPFAAMITKREFNTAVDISLGHYTHEKSPLGAAAGLAMLEFIEQQQLLEKSKALEAIFYARLNEMKHRFALIGDVRGIGCLWGIELVKDRSTKEKASIEAEQVMYECLQNGLSFKISQGNVLQLCPPLVITKQELATALDIIEAAIAKLSN